MAYISIPIYWRSVPERYSLIGYKCRKCEAINFPYKDTCAKCGAKADFDQVELSRRGRVYSYSVIATGSSPPEFSRLERVLGQYVIAIVELEGGVRVMAQLTECKADEVRVGMKVEATVRVLYEDEGVIRYGLKFRPVRVKGS